MPSEGVAAAAKYAELDARGEPRPRCRCHDHPMHWQLRKDFAVDGGRWQCSVQRRSRDRRRIRMSAGGITFFIGVAPTPETAAQLRQRIKEDAPK